MRSAIVTCFGLRNASISSNQSTASEIEKLVTSVMVEPCIFTASAAGLRRCPSHVSQFAADWYRLSSSLNLLESVSLNLRSRFGTKPSNGFWVV